MTHRRRPTDNEVDAYIDRERQAEGSEYERIRESLWLAAIRRADEEEFGPDLAVALPQYVDVVIDADDPAHPAFVEIENQDGASVRIGEDVDQHDGYRRIRIRAADLWHAAADGEAHEARALMFRLAMKGSDHAEEYDAVNRADAIVAMAIRAAGKQAGR
jgi:hypothetical protein